MRRHKRIRDIDCQHDCNEFGKDNHTRAKKKTTVRFAEHCEVRMVPNRLEYSKQEMLDMHFSKQDLLEVRKECRSIMTFMARGIYPDNDKVYFRGLECRLDNRRHDRRRKILETRQALIEMQIAEMLDPEWIDTCYKQLTYEATAKAHNLGRYDASQSLRVKQWRIGNELN
eukprot:jgi/Psemu1/29346/gm1.29346_g